MSNEVVIERIFNAPVQRVWDAWTKPEEAAKWWGPKHFTAPHMQIDLRVGGKYLFCMHGNEGLSPEFIGKDFWTTGTYKEIVPLQKLVCTDSFSDKDGNIVDPKNFGMPPETPMIMEITILFEDLGDKTKMMAEIQDYLKKRIGKYPASPSGGSFFKNIDIEKWPQKQTDVPEEFIRGGKIPAGWLIDKAGLKGTQVGGCMVSKEHGNFIINNEKNFITRLYYFIRYILNLNKNLKKPEHYDFYFKREDLGRLEMMLNKIK
jgi:uncharacterized protein YndB with AHSA1/START domain